MTLARVSFEFLMYGRARIINTAAYAHEIGAGRAPRPVEVVAGDRVRWQGEKGPKRRFWLLSGDRTVGL